MLQKNKKYSVVSKLQKIHIHKIEKASKKRTLPIASNARSRLKILLESSVVA